MEFIPIAPDLIPRISYIQVAIPVHTKDKSQSEKIIEYILSSDGKAAYEKYGYLTNEKEAREFAPGATIGGEYKLPPKYFKLIKDGVLTK